MSETYVTVAGNVATVPEHRITQGGAGFAKFRLATTPRRVDRATGRWNDGPTSFYTVVCWRQLGDNVMASLSKGDPVVVVGRLRVNSWESDRGSGTTVEIDASHAGPDLTKGIAFFRRSRGARPAEPDRRPDAEQPAHDPEPPQGPVDDADLADPGYDSGPLVRHQPGEVSRDTAA